MAGGNEADALPFPEAMIEAAQTVFDVVAMPAETPFIRHAAERNIQTISGAEVIVLQAVEQFALYTWQRPSKVDNLKAAALSRAG